MKNRGTNNLKKNLFTGTFAENVITALSLLSDFRKMKTKRGRAFEKCRKKAGRSSTFDSEVWHPRNEEHTIAEFDILNLLQ